MGFQVFGLNRVLGVWVDLASLRFLWVWVFGGWLLDDGGWVG